LKEKTLDSIHTLRRRISKGQPFFSSKRRACERESKLVLNLRE
jgi:hypothetical protein